MSKKADRFESIVPSPLIVIGAILGSILAIVLMFVAFIFGLVIVAIVVPIMKLRRWHSNWYSSRVTRARRFIECEARRFGGTVEWRD